MISTNNEVYACSCNCLHNCNISFADFQPPNITRHPMSGIIPLGFSHTLMCSAIGSGTLRYSWERSSNGNSWTTVSGDNTTAYATDTSLAIGEYMYRCNVSNEAGSVVSNIATVILYGEYAGVEPPIRLVRFSPDHFY